MFERVVMLVSIYFLIGALVIFVINKKRTGDARERWIKFGFYFLVVYSVLFFANYLAAYFYLFALCIVLIGYSELIKNRTGAAKQGFVLASLFIYSLLATGFIYFSYAFGSTHILWLYTLVLTFDGFSQLSGQLFGKLKIAGTISPNKTGEGLLGGFIITIGTAYILKPLFLNDLSPGSYFMLVSAVCVFAFFADLLASYYKRRVHVKDYSRLIPGHGGVLDRFDSFIGAACAVVLFFCWMKS